MADINWKDVEAIIDEALVLPKDKRQKFIDRTCGENIALKSEVTLLLKSIFDSEGWLENPGEYKKQFYKDTFDNPETPTPGSSLIETQVGPYQIKELLGEGGMGLVYLAERTDGAFEHQVAFKVLREGMDTEHNIQRFRQERNILAGLNHPNIAGILDGGVTEKGLPYLIMEYVEGLPIDEYCNRHKCTINERIELFKSICRAVQHAHNNLIIHRDLKPANILVNADGHVKILDFGIAKLLQRDNPETSWLQTRTGARILTLSYAAPEQVSGQPITTGVDNYALGTLLSKLLTGVHPFDKEGKSIAEMEKLITEVTPLKSSERFDKLPDDQKEELSHQLKSTPAKIVHALKGDLDAIILKNLRKEPKSRYNSPNQLLEDLERFEKGLPVIAQKDSTAYHINKFFKRHKKGLAATAGALLVLIGLTAFYTWRITEERNQAQLQAERAEEITDFLVSILQMNNPSENLGKNITVSDALIRGIDYLDDQRMSAFNQAIILGTIGSIQINIGDIDRAGTSLKRAINLVTDSLKEQSNRTLAIGTEYAEWQETIGNNKKAEQIFQLTDSLFQANQLTQSTSFLAHLLNYSDFLMEIGQFEKAMKALSKSEEYFQNSSDEDPSTLNLRADLYNNLGRAYKNMGQNNKALEDLEKALALKKKIYNEDNPKIGKLYHNMGVVYGTVREFKKAMDMAEKAYEIRVNTLGPDHQLVGSTLHLMGNLALELDNYDQAFKYIKRSIAINGKQHGTNHFRYAFAIREYAKALAKTGRYEEAGRQLDKAASIIIDNYGKEHAYYGYLTYTYATIFGEAGNYAQAMQYGQQSISIFEKNFGSRHPNVGKAYFQQGKFALKRSQFKQADTLLTTALKTFELHFDDGNTFIEQTDSLLSVTKEQFQNSTSSNSPK